MSERALGLPFGTPLAMHPGYEAGITYDPTAPIGPRAATTVPSVDTLLGYIWYNPKAVGISALNARCTTAAAGSAMKTATWRFQGRRAIGKPVVAVDAGASTAATGNVPMAISGVLPKGWLFTASKFNGTPGMSCVDMKQWMAWLLGGTVTQATAATQMQALTVADAYANLLADLDLTGVTLSPFSTSAAAPAITFTAA